MKGYKFYITLIILALSCVRLSAQEVPEKEKGNQESDYRGIAASVYVDSIFITAEPEFDIDGFIKLVIEDESFYNAFKSLRNTPYTYKTHMSFIDKNDTIAKYRSIKDHKLKDSCFYIRKISEEDGGDFFNKNRVYNYYTASLFHKIFEESGTSCTQSSGNATKKGRKASAISYHIDMMKQVIFSPGKAVDMPLVGEKMAIFSEKMQKYYDYSIERDLYKNSINTIAFRVKAKDDYMDSDRDVIIREMDTFFDKETLEIVARNYTLRYDNYLYDFDIHISIELMPHGTSYIPSSITYDGYWNIILKPAEKALVEVEFYRFK